MIVLLDADKLKEKDVFHPYFKEKLSIKGYHGNNLDAMWDALSSFNRKLRIYIYNYKEMKNEKETYRNDIIEILEELEETYNNISFKIINIRKKESRMHEQR